MAIGAIIAAVVIGVGIYSGKKMTPCELRNFQFTRLNLQEEHGKNDRGNITNVPVFIKIQMKEGNVPEFNKDNDIKCVDADASK